MHAGLPNRNTGRATLMLVHATFAFRVPFQTFRLGQRHQGGWTGSLFTLPHGDPKAYRGCTLTFDSVKGWMKMVAAGGSAFFGRKPKEASAGNAIRRGFRLWRTVI